MIMRNTFCVNRYRVSQAGPLHFVGGSQRYDMKTSLKHRLLTKQGWDVHHIAWNAVWQRGFGA